LYPIASALRYTLSAKNSTGISTTKNLQSFGLRALAGISTAKNLQSFGLGALAGISTVN